jgi:SAM-dependent methyltransferase|tara:strand:+ start:777 stop:1622 length:846 start_codon:yes stop_codon:yes gene_type:complete
MLFYKIIKIGTHGNNPMLPRDTPNLGQGLPGGSKHYRAFVGLPENYDIVSSMQFNLLTQMNLRENHSVLDIGCGSLRAGRLLIPYLLPKKYFGLEPEKWLIDDAIKYELGQDIIEIKKPVFSYDEDFNFGAFNEKFDYVLAQSIFSHAPEKTIRKCAIEVEKVMKPDSIFVATFYEGTENYTGTKWAYPENVYYTFEKIKKIFEEANLICRRLDWNSGLQNWILITKPENKDYSVEFSDFTKQTNMVNQLNSYKEQLKKIESHPYVKFGLKVRNILNKIRH